MSNTDAAGEKRVTGTSERREQIIQRLRQQGSVQVNDLSALFGVSTVTIRNDPARIFAIFWLTLALVLMLVLMLPKLDSRQMTELLDSEQRQGLMIEQHVEAELANDPPNDLMWWRRLFRAIDKWARQKR